VAHDDKPLDLNDELLRALVDGELDERTAARVEAQLAHEPQAAEFVQRERALRQRLQAAYAPVVDEPVPDRLLAALGKAPPAANDASARAPVLDLATAREARQAPQRRFSGWAPWMGMAASLALGVFAGMRLAPAEGPMVASAEGRWIASAQLAQALDTQSAAAQPADAPVRLATSFVAQDGRYCRSFTLSRDAMAGLACREGEGWRVEVLAKTEAQPSGSFRQAASALPTIVLQAMDARIAGAPLDAAAEQQALQRHWQR
jgi:hypothetical protein